jgi:hypothetical protein
MLGALLYLRLTSLKNLVRSRLLRLRQPKYLFGAIVGAAYFYFILSRPISGAGRAVAPGAGQRPAAAALALPSWLRPLHQALDHH